MVRTTFFSMMTSILLSVFFCISLPAQPDNTKRQKNLEDLLKYIDLKRHGYVTERRVTFQDSTWMDWLKRSGELPPDFDQLPSVPFLPEPLTLNENGKEIPILTKEQWQKKRELIKKEFQYWVSGTRPPAPKSFESEILSDRMEGGTHIQMIVMKFGPGNKARMTFELMIPEGKGPFPVYLTQWSHRNWAQLAVRRGYIGCVYAAADDKDDTQSYQSLYPEYDFSQLMRRAWGASRVVDYLVTCKEVNKDQIAITGHSRNGKQSLWAGAFDERITAVVSSSCGTGGITPWRYSDSQYVNGTLDAICAYNPQWFHPRLRFFFGREDKLPVDQNLLISLIAPRILLLHYSVMETELNPWVNEQCYNSVKKVYSFLGAEGNAGVLTRMGEHAVSTRDLERCIDYLDIKFKRKQIPWENKLYFDYSYPKWAEEHKADSLEAMKIKIVKLKQNYGNISEFETQKKLMLTDLHWLLGKEPSGVKPGDIKPTSAGDWMDNITGRPVVKGAAITHFGPYSDFGVHMRAMLYTPVDKDGNRMLKSNGKIPVVIFLHQYAYAHGFAKGTRLVSGVGGNSSIFQGFIDKGFAVLAMDMIGFGTRLEEGTYFYERFPKWSRMGMMVSDTKACIDALETFDYIDNKKIFLLGNTIGGSVAFMTAAGDERVAGVAVVSAFSPWRESNNQVESLRTYSHLHGFIPRLGFFAGIPQNTPVDFGEIISCIAPRPLMIISPQLDRYTSPDAIKKTIKLVQGVYDLYGKSDQLVFRTPLEVNRMTEDMRVDVTGFFEDVLSK